MIRSRIKLLLHMYGLWPTVAESVDRMAVLQVRRVLLTLAQTEYDKDTTAVLVKYGVQTHGYRLYGLQDVWY
jgi:hypothetical protein